MAGVTLIVTVDQVARQAGLAVPVPPGSDTEARITAAVTAVQARMEEALGQPITPTQVTEHGLWPGSPTLFPATGGWLLTHTPVLQIISAVAETDPDSGAPTGMFAVTYTYGLDGAAVPYLVNFALERAALHPNVAVLVPAGERRVSAVSTGAQSVTYEKASTEAADEPASYEQLAASRWSVRGRRAVGRFDDPLRRGYGGHRQVPWWY